MDLEVQVNRVIIAGGRDFNDYFLLERKCDAILKNLSNVTVLCGLAEGADSHGFYYAKKRGIPVDEYPAPWNETEGKPANQVGTRKDGTKYWKGAGPHRNEQMAANATHLILFWDGKSSGSKDMKRRAEAHNLKIRIISYGN